MEIGYLLPGQERCTPLPPKDGRSQVAYSFRTEHGALFQCVCRDAEEAHHLCEDWMRRQERY